ncbi:sugar transferase [Moheibacter lacus]|uniref:Sugar transferase n=1 Tax=Moheibacter lacus TaxID=2745851 RepID=A0A838ZL05_9FLAO|nr:sugar transferase [Moheibacter lacus]MBA5628380.1 sugar transferase [Moheibacter lacus]
MKVKALLDYALAILLLPVLLPIVFILILIATLDTGQFGLFSQIRVGKNAEFFKIFKIRSMKGKHEVDITTEKTHKITWFGQFLRNSKLDETPQIFNILLGQMSFVGPRPDVPGYADQLKDENRIILTVKPGITGPAQIAFQNEEEILNQVENPQRYNDEVLWPEKVRINKSYVENWTFSKDLNYLFQTIFNQSVSSNAFNRN